MDKFTLVENYIRRIVREQKFNEVTVEDYLKTIDVPKLSDKERKSLIQRIKELQYIVRSNARYPDKTDFGPVIQKILSDSEYDDLILGDPYQDLAFLEDKLKELNKTKSNSDTREKVKSEPFDTIDLSTTRRMDKSLERKGKRYQTQYKDKKSFINPIYWTRKLKDVVDEFGDKVL